MKRKTGCFILAEITGFLFLLLILLVKTVNVGQIGPEGTSIGLSNLNQAVHDAFAFQPFWYKVTQLLGYASLLLVGVFAVVGLLQLIRRKSLFKVDREILALGVFYAVVLGLYVLFEIIVVNYRPMIMPDEAHVEASFPSSHTVLGVAVLGSAALVLKKYIVNPVARVAVQALCVVLILVMVVGRLLSGVHWFTDILAGALLSTSLLSLFAAFAFAPEKQELLP